MLTLTPPILLFTGLAVTILSVSKSNSKLIVWMLLTYMITFTTEAIGVKTGLIFGNYSYGDSLGLKLFSVPLLIGFNWLLIILGSITIAQSIEKNLYTTSVLSGVFCVLFDLMLEPAAIALDYWRWDSGSIPLRNYYAWFLIAFISSIIYGKMNIKNDNVLFRFYFLVQLLFFVILSWILG